LDPVADCMVTNRPTGREYSNFQAYIIYICVLREVPVMIRSVTTIVTIYTVCITCNNYVARPTV